MSVVCCDYRFVGMLIRDALDTPPKAVIDRNGLSYGLYSMSIHCDTKTFSQCHLVADPNRKKG